MRKNISIRSYRKPDILYSPLDLVVCEGETEVDYLCEFARNLHFQFRESGFGSPQQMVKALKKLPGFEDYDKDGVQIFRTTVR